MSLTRKIFKRLYYPVDIIAQCVCGYLAYALSLRNLEEMRAGHGVVVDHSTLYRWVIKLTLLLDKAFRPSADGIGRHRTAVHDTHPEGDGLSPAEQFYLLAG